MTTKKTKIEIHESISSRIQFKRKFNFFQLYCSLVFLPRAMSKLMGNKKSKLVDLHFIERLQLSVTEVNGCAACSYQHTKMALSLGMSADEINSFLIGNDNFIKPEEAKGILFAQHFADSTGFPKKYAYDTIVKEYKSKEAKIILSACQVMIAGNMYGIPYSAFQSRIKGKPFKDSTLFYELGMLIAGIFCLPIAILQGFLRALVGLPNEKFDKSVAE